MMETRCFKGDSEIQFHQFFCSNLFAKINGNMLNDKNYFSYDETALFNFGWKFCNIFW